MEMVFPIISLAIVIFIIAGAWKVYVKAGQAGWKCLIPIYNTIVMLQIVNRPIWWIILFFIPFVGLIASIIVINDLSKSFGKGIGFTIGIIFLGFIFIPILGYGSAEFVGRPQAEPSEEPSEEPSAE